MNQGNKLLDCADDWMNRDPVTAYTQQTAQAIATIMADNNIGCVLILSKEKKSLFGNSPSKLVGIITDTDIVRKVVAKNLNPQDIKAQDIMSTSLKLIEPNYPMIEISKLIADNRIKRLPVVNENQQLKGIITITDVMYSMVKLGRLYDLSQLVRYWVKKDIDPQDTKDVMKVKNWMVTDVVTAKPIHTLYEISTIMSVYKLGAVPIVTEKKQVIGMLTDTDIVRDIAKKKYSSSTQAETIMTKKIIYCSPEDSLMDVGALMTKHKFKRMPILKDDILVGIISVTDIINIMLQLNNISQAHKIITEMLYKGNADVF